MNKTAMKSGWLSVLAVGCAAVAQGAMAQTVAQREVRFYSEGVLCYGKLFLPSGFSESSKAAAVVLAAGAPHTSTSIEKYAEDVAAHGMVALTFDYRGWGKSGGFLYFGEPVRFDDRLRFQQNTAKMHIRRKRLEPQLQLIDIRNAITFVQGEPGIDRSRIGVWGAELAGDHAIAVAGTDARVKAVVAQLPSLEGKDVPRKAFAPTPEQQAAMVKLARTGVAPATNQAGAAMNAVESKLAFADYHPFWYVDQIAPTTAVRFIVAEKSASRSTETNIAAAAKLLKGPADIVKIPDAKAADAAIHATTEWFAKNL